MNIRTNPDTGVAEIQVGEDEWRPIEEVALEATEANKSLRTFIQEKYGRVIERPLPANT